MTDSVLYLENVSKIYKLYEKPVDRFKETFSKKQVLHKEFYALENVTINIDRGETVGVIGRNGSGKSTLLKIITGVLNPTEGTLKRNGSISALLELGAGFNMEYTGIENIYLNGTIMNIPKKEVDKKVNDIIKFADIGEHINQPVKTYSSGMFVRLAFAVAISVDPDILIVDEALAVGDTRFQVKCMDKFMEFMQAGKTILFVSHDLNSVKRFCNRTIWLNEGRIVMDGETDVVTDSYNDFLASDLNYADYLVARKAQKNISEKYKEVDFSGIDIAQIVEAKLYNKYNQEIEEVQHGEDLYLKIKYVVKETVINNPVLGVAIRNINDEYICGLNTLLDNQKIKWEKGINECVLKYKKFNLTGGNYYFDIALFDSTATVQFDYEMKYKTFFVKMDYIAEGKVVLNHQWEC